MSWDASLIVNDIEWAGRHWNYTHNTSCMIYDALKEAGAPLADDVRWWQALNGMSGAAGCLYLSMIIEQLEKNPDKYRAMNPPNGWGNYDGILKTLIEMRDACTSEIPMTWEASG